MPRKLLLAASALVTMALAFAAASYAVERQGEPRLRSNLPAADLPAIALAENEAFAINNLIGPHVDRFGITRESYANVRLIAETAAGPLYLIPGSRGACLVLDSGAACGDPGAPGESTLALLTTTPLGQQFVGGGVTTDDVTRVRMTPRGGKPTYTTVERGVFAVTPSDGLVAPSRRPIAFATG